MTESMQRTIVIVGPTASGKSALAVEIARRFSGEIISADSRQVYRGLTIGSGKITSREMKGVPHHLLDVASLRRSFSAHRFAALGRIAMEDIAGRGHVAIICGGTGFYIDALLGNVQLSEVPPDATLRIKLGTLTKQQLFRRLARMDPARAARIDPNNKRRLIRAIEIASSSRQSLIKAAPASHSQVLWIGLRPPPADLRSAINARLIARLRAGMVAEGRHLHESGLAYRRMRDLGLEYRSLARLLTQEITRKEFIQELQAAIWQFAKRQMTYWRRNAEIKWYTPKEKESIFEEVRRFLYS